MPNTVDRMTDTADRMNDTVDRKSGTINHIFLKVRLLGGIMRILKELVLGWFQIRPLEKDHLLVKMLF